MLMAIVIAGRRGTRLDLPEMGALAYPDQADLSSAVVISSRREGRLNHKTGVAMKLISCVIRTERLGAVKGALFQAGVTGISISRVSGHGGEQEVVERCRGSSIVLEFREKVKVEMARSEPIRRADDQGDSGFRAHWRSGRRKNVCATAGTGNSDSHRGARQCSSDTRHRRRGTAAGARCHAPGRRAMRHRARRPSDAARTIPGQSIRTSGSVGIHYLKEIKCPNECPRQDACRYLHHVLAHPAGCASLAPCSCCRWQHPPKVRKRRRKAHR